MNIFPSSSGGDGKVSGKPGACTTGWGASTSSTPCLGEAGGSPEPSTGSEALGGTGLGTVAGGCGQASLSSLKATLVTLVVDGAGGVASGWNFGTSAEPGPPYSLERIC